MAGVVKTTRYADNNELLAPGIGTDILVNCSVMLLGHVSLRVIQACRDNVDIRSSWLVLLLPVGVSVAELSEPRRGHTGELCPL